MKHQVAERNEAATMTKHRVRRRGVRAYRRNNVCLLKVLQGLSEKILLFQQDLVRC
jgi:hypothetical protein